MCHDPPLLVLDNFLVGHLLLRAALALLFNDYRVLLEATRHERLLLPG
jgi:hypothetical protein